MQVGAAIVASRLVVGEVGPVTLAMLRYAIGFCFLLPFVLRSNWPPVPADRTSLATKTIALDILAMAALGIGQFGILIALMNWGLQHIGAAPAAMIFSLFPLITLCLSAALGRERFTVPLLVGVLLSISGVVLTVSASQPAGWKAAPGHVLGELAVLASALVGALCSVFYRPYLQRYPTLHVSAFAMLASVLFLAVLAWPEGWIVRVPALGWRTWGVIGFIGLSSGIGYVWWLYALKHESATRVTVFLALNPLTATLLASLVLAEPPGWRDLAAVLLVGAGLWFATRGGAHRPR